MGYRGIEFDYWGPTGIGRRRTVDSHGNIVQPPRCWPLTHEWDEGQDALGPDRGCDSYTVRYTCRKCGKIKDRGGH